MHFLLSRLLHRSAPASQIYLETTKIYSVWFLVLLTRWVPLLDGGVFILVIFQTKHCYLSSGSMQKKKRAEHVLYIIISKVLICSGVYGHFYFTLIESTALYHSSTSLYLTLHYSCMSLLHSTWLYIILPWLYFSLHDSTMDLLDSTFSYHSSTWLYITLPWLYFTLIESTVLYHSSASFYLTLQYSTVVLLHST